ncbi:MAG: hypothetical protein IKE69_00685 [Thermoguttaceae bacterium]|nr:hypothetical protein [Thermoguttaceae bacterium]
MNGSIRKRGRFTFIGLGIFGLAISGLTLFQNENIRFFGIAPARADEPAAETVLPEEEFALDAAESAESAAPGGETAPADTPPADAAAETAPAETAAEEPEGIAVTAPQNPLPDVVDESSKQAEEPETYSTENPEAADAKVMLVDPSEAVTEPTAPSESVEEVTTPPVMEETIISPEAQSEDELGDDSAEMPGFPDAQQALKEMYDDVVGGINTRRVNSIYERWQKYAASILAKTNKFYTGLELNNRCRLRWYDQLYRNPVSSVFYVEVFSRELYANFSSKNPRRLIKGVRQARAKLDIVPSTEEIRIPNVATGDDALLFLKLTLDRAAKAYARAMEPLTPDEIRAVAKESFTIFSAQTRVGHTVPSLRRAQYLVDVMDKMDYSALFDAGEALLPLVDRRMLDALARIDISMLEQVTIGGKTVGRIPTSAGDVFIGGPESNTWDLDSKELENAVCVIDLGGSDTYREGVCNPGRPILVLLDLGEGNDEYTGTRPGIQGSAIMGISLLYNDAGDTSYNARDIAQGSAIGGIGMLIDNGGNDKYLGFKRVQSTAICGLGLLIDRQGDDDYHAALMAQGVGNPRGFAAFADLEGNDHYYCGGYYLDSYPEPEYPGYDGWAQGIGAGIRGVGCGGIGAFMEGDGDDIYEFDYFGHGGGYWMGLGFARDFGGNDTRIGATLKAYNGGPRSEARHQRFSNGFGCHYALGYLFDDGGDDSYSGTIMGIGMAWDLSAGFLVDYAGNDIYSANGGLVEGCGAEGSLGFLFDYRGDDEYRGGYNQMNQGYANPRITYHTAYDCGGNFSFLVDHGGADKYSCNARNNTMTQRGMNTGFIIDRPTSDELAGLQEKGETVSLDDKTPLEDSKQAYVSDPKAEWTANRYSDSVNHSKNNDPFPGGPFGFGRRPPQGGGGFWGF